MKLPDVRLLRAACAPARADSQVALGPRVAAIIEGSSTARHNTTAEDLAAECHGEAALLLSHAGEPHTDIPATQRVLRW
jgi:hypothetical protein